MHRSCQNLEACIFTNIPLLLCLQLLLVLPVVEFLTAMNATV